MQVLYGQSGQPVGSVEGDAVFLRDGKQSAFLVDGHLYEADDGTWIGSMMSGIVFNVHGAPQAFTDNCEDALIAPQPPHLRSSLPPKVLAVGNDVRGLPAIPIPQFLRDWLDGSTRWRDGIFQ